MTFVYCPDIIDWAHVVRVIENEAQFRDKYKEMRRHVNEQNRKYLKKK